MSTKYECMGGPADGSCFPQQLGLAIKTDDDIHYYRFVVLRATNNKCAKFFHYTGTKWITEFTPRLRPHKRAFKFDE